MASKQDDLGFDLHPLFKDKGILDFETHPSDIGINQAYQSDIQDALPDIYSRCKEVLTAQSLSINLVNRSKRIAVCFSGGPAPGGHNVILAIAKLCEENSSELLGVLNGPGGLVKGDFLPLSYKECAYHLNTGGFDLLGTDRTKIKSESQFQAVEEQVKTHRIDAIIIIGGDDSQTNAVFLAQRLLALNCAVIGVPKTIDGDLRYPPYLPISFGFSTAVDVYSNLVNALIKDTLSVKKYWHIVKLMGRSTGHIAKAVGERCHVDALLLGEEVKAQGLSFDAIIDQLCDIVLSSIKKQKNCGVICVAEGLLEWIPKLNIEELVDEPLAYDSHGNLELSRIHVEQILIKAMTKKLSPLLGEDVFKAIPHYYGYEGRCVEPNDFDKAYTYHLGLVAASLALSGKTGYMAACTGIDKTAAFYAVPIINMLHQENRLGDRRLVVKKFVLNPN